MTKSSTIILCIFAFILSGCNKDTAHYKNDADKEVYGIIDQQWQSDFGPKSNYKIADSNTVSDDIGTSNVALDILPRSEVLTLEDAVYIATQNNRRYQSEKEELYVKALDLTLAAHQFAPSYFSKSDVGYSVDSQDELIAAAGNFGFQRLYASGTQLSTDIAFAWVDILSGDLRSGLGAVFQATITKPLLRDSQTKVLIENLTQAQRDSLYQIRLFSRFRKEFTVSVITSYYDTLLCYEKLENACQNHAQLTEIYELMEKMVKVGRLEKFELQQVQQDILESRDIRIRQQNKCKQALDELKIIMSIPPTTEIAIDTEGLSAIVSANLSAPEFTEQQAVVSALSTRLDLLNTADSINDAQRKIDVAAHAFKARLDITASTASVTKRVTSSTGLGSLKSSNSLGLELDLPLDRKAERNQYRKALINLEQAKRQYQESRDIAALQVRTAFRNLTQAASVSDVQLKSLDLAADRLKKTSVLLQYGRSNTRDILDAQEDLFDAKNAAAEAVVDFTIATLDFYRDAGVMQIKEDGMWETKQACNEPVVTKPAKSQDPEEVIAKWLKTKKYN